MSETDEREMSADCPCGHPRDEHVAGVGCMAPAEFHSADTFCACPWPLDDARQQQRRADGAGEADR